VPKLYEYLGLIVFFYANEHEPVHVHCRKENRESRAELILVDGKVAEILLTGVRGKLPLTAGEARDFLTLVERFSSEIVQKWIDFFVLHKAVTAEHIARRLK